jgi:hypothetical protein
VAAFSVTVNQVSPLQIQLGTPATVGAEIRAFDAWGETPTGSSSLPRLYRPSIPGTARQSSESVRLVCLDHPGRDTALEVLTAFSTSPSYPDVAPVKNSPGRVAWAAPPGNGFVILPNFNYAALYARVDYTGQPTTQAELDYMEPSSRGGFVWNAQLIWEEY